MKNISYTWSFPTKKTKQKFEKEINSLFSNAKKQDEREFVIANLYYAGIMQVSSAYDTKEELDKTIEQFFNLSALFVKDFSLFIKVSLLLYCHILEFHYLYTFIYGLLDIQLGESFDVQIFDKPKQEKNPQDFINQIKSIIEIQNSDKFKRDKINKLCNNFSQKPMSNWNKINKIYKKSKQVGSSIHEVIMEFFDNDLRNAFSHTSYTISNQGMALTNIHRFYKFKDLTEKIMNCFYFYSSLSQKNKEVIKKIISFEETNYQGKYGNLNIKPRKSGKRKVKFSLSGSSKGKSL